MNRTFSIDSKIGELCTRIEKSTDAARNCSRQKGEYPLIPLHDLAIEYQNGIYLVGLYGFSGRCMAARKTYAIFKTNSIVSTEEERSLLERLKYFYHEPSSETNNKGGNGKGNKRLVESYYDNPTKVIERINCPELTYTFDLGKLFLCRERSDGTLEKIEDRGRDTWEMRLLIGRSSFIQEKTQKKGFIGWIKDALS